MLKSNLGVISLIIPTTYIAEISIKISRYQEIKISIYQGIKKTRRLKMFKLWIISLCKTGYIVDLNPETLALYSYARIVL